MVGVVGISVEGFERIEGAFQADVPSFGRITVEVHLNTADFWDNGRQSVDAGFEVEHNFLTLLRRKLGFELKEYDVFYHK